MSNPILEYRPLGPKRRDALGIASISLLAIHIGLIVLFRGPRVPSALVVCIDIPCVFMSVVFALSGIVLMRGKSFGWIVLAFLAAAIVFGDYL